MSVAEVWRVVVDPRHDRGVVFACGSETRDEGIGGSGVCAGELGFDA